MNNTTLIFHHNDNHNEHFRKNENLLFITSA